MQKRIALNNWGLFFFFFEGRQTLSALVQLPPLGACGYLRVCNLLETLLHLLSSGVIKKAESESLRGAKETPLELSQTENLRAATRLNSQAACPDCVCVCLCVYEMKKISLVDSFKVLQTCKCGWMRCHSVLIGQTTAARQAGSWPKVKLGLANLQIHTHTYIHTQNDSVCELNTCCKLLTCHISWLFWNYKPFEAECLWQKAVPYLSIPCLSLSRHLALAVVPLVFSKAVSVKATVNMPFKMKINNNMQTAAA